MDAADFDDLAGRLYGLLIGLGDRLRGKQARLLHGGLSCEYGRKTCIEWWRGP